MHVVSIKRTCPYSCLIRRSQANFSCINRASHQYISYIKSYRLVGVARVTSSWWYQYLSISYIIYIYIYYIFFSFSLSLSYIYIFKSICKPFSCFCPTLFGLSFFFTTPLSFVTFFFFVHTTIYIIIVIIITIIITITII